jgi:hypothetical protein
MRNNRGTQLISVPIRFHSRATKFHWEIAHENGSTWFVGGAPPRIDVGNTDLGDGWELVRRFLTLRSEDEESILEFLIAHGQFRSPIQESRKLPPGYPLVVFDQIPIHAFATIQDYMRRMLILGNATLPAPWHRNEVQEYTIAFTESRSGSRAEVLVDGTFPSMLATIQFKLLQGANFKSCARKDCRLPFEVTSRHTRLFCSQYCAHITSLRQRRKLERKRQANEHGSRHFATGRIK